VLALWCFPSWTPGCLRESNCGPMAEKHNHKFCTAVKRALAKFGTVPKPAGHRIEDRALGISATLRECVRTSES
jgi:hypothetical protein